MLRMKKTNINNNQSKMRSYRTSTFYERFNFGIVTKRVIEI